MLLLVILFVILIINLHLTPSLIREPVAIPSNEDCPATNGAREGKMTVPCRRDGCPISFGGFLPM
jgi:hypothetical protein